MAKRLIQRGWWIAVGVVILTAIILVARQQHTAAREYEAERETRCTKAFPFNPEQQNACDHERDGPGNYLPWGYALVAWPEGITTWAILFTLGVVIWQTTATSKAAKAAERTAEAALRQADHMVASERAWIMVDTGEIPDDFEPDPNALQYMELRPIVRNCGKTIARIKMISVRAHAVTKPTDLPVDPEYRGSVDLALLPLPPAAVIQPAKVMVDLRDFIGYREGRSLLYIYGFVDYQVLDIEERKTRFCFKYVVPGGFSGMKRGFYIATDVPKKYTQST